MNYQCSVTFKLHICLEFQSRMCNHFFFVQLGRDWVKIFFQNLLSLQRITFLFPTMAPVNYIILNLSKKRWNLTIMTGFKNYKNCILYTCFLFLKIHQNCHIPYNFWTPHSTVFFFVFHTLKLFNVLLFVINIYWKVLKFYFFVLCSA
jgi:hypothetical protein